MNDKKFYMWLVTFFAAIFATGFTFGVQSFYGFALSVVCLMVSLIGVGWESRE